MRKRLFVFFGIILAAVMLAGCGKKEFKVTFDVNGGTPAVAEQLVKKGELADVPTPEPTREGYTFEGWFLEETQWKFSEDKVTKTITLVAKWKEKVDPVVEKVRVVFDARGGTPAPDMQQVEKGKKAVKPADPVLAGQTFTGWYLDGVLFDFNTALNEDTTLVARYVETETVTVTFIASGGEPAPENAVIEKGTALPEPAEMTLDKHEFLGWFLNDELYNFELPVESNILLVAKWERIYENYTVTFDIGYEGGEEIDSQTVREEDYATEPQIDDRIGYRLLGWYDGDEKFEFTSLVLKDLNLVAKWEEEFVVSFDINYDEGEDVAPQLILKNEKANKPQIADREFYKFEGWFIDGEEQPFDFDTPITSDIHLVGKWTELDTYNITYHNVTDDMFVYGTKKEMVEAYLTDFYNFVDSGFSLEAFMHGVGKTEGFDGLWVESNASIYNGAEPDLDNPNNLFFAYSEEYMAKWKPFHDMMHEFVVNVNATQFFYGAGTWTGLIRLREYIIDMPERAPHINMMPNPLIKNTPVKVHLGEEEIKLLAPYRYDAEFLGWYDNAEFSGEPITVIPADTKADFDVYAKWDEADRFAVTFDIGYPEGVSPDAQEVLDGHKATKPAEPARRPGHRFQGWFLEGAEVAFDFNTPITEAITLVAKWNEVNEAKVTFDYDTEGVDDVIEWVIVDSTISEPAEPEKENYRFLGWFVGDETDAFDFDTPITADITLVAKWEELDVFTITYNLSGGELFDGFATREAMLDAFLTDFYNFLEAKGHLDSSKVSLNDFMHGKGKTSGYDGLYIDISNEADGYFQKLYTVTDSVPIRDVAPETGSFINQVEYNAKWLPFLDLVEEYSQLAGDAGFWKSKFIGFRRLKPFIQGKNLWLNKAEEAAIILATIPNEYAVPRYEYNIDDETFYLPQATHPTLEFNGWYDNAEFSGEPIVKVEKGSTGNLDLYANFGVPLERYKVEFSLGYDGLTLDDKYVLQGDKVFEPANPVRPTYEFLGWFLNLADEDPFDFDTIIEDDLVLIAKWEKLAEIIVEFDLNYEGAEEMADVTLGVGEKVAKPADPVRDGYTFMGWFVGEVAYDFNLEVNEGIKLVAQWRKIIPMTFELNDGYLDAEALMDLYGQEAFVATRYHKEDAYFAGDRVTVSRYSRAYWYVIGLVETEIPGVYEIYGKGTSYEDDAVDLYFRIHDDLKKEEGGTPIFNAIKAFYDKAVVGEKMAIGALPAASGVNLAIDVVNLGDLDLDAKPVFNFYDLDALLAPVKADFNFVSWHLEDDLSDDAYVLPEELDEAITLYAKWVAKVYFDVTFDSDGGSAVAAQEVEDGYKAVKPANPTKEGFTFEGWFVGEDEFDFNDPITADIELKAKWEALDEFTVTFKVDENDEDPLVIEVFDGFKVTKPADPAEREGYLFDGWFLGEAEEAFDFNTAITENIVLVGKWREVEKVTISFDLKYEGAPAMDDVKIEKGTKLAKPADPERVGYVFLGWFEDEAEVAFDFTANIDDDVALEAKWLEIVEYTITYELNGGQFMLEFDDSDDMKVAFLTDYYNWLVLKEHIDGTAISVTDFIHGDGKESGYDGLYNDAGYFSHMYTVNDKSIDASKAKFVNQPEYNPKWIPFLDLIDEYASTGNPAQSFWGSIAYGGQVRIKPFMQSKNLWPGEGEPKASQIAEITSRVPQEYFVPRKYENISDDIALGAVVVKEDVDFLGWYDNAEFEGDEVTKIAKEKAENIKLYAKWGALPEYTVTFDLGYDGADNPADQVIEKGSLVEEPAKPVREGYTFEGWYVGEALYDFADPVVEGFALVAKWEKLPVQVIYDLGEYGYISDETKLTLFEDFVTDWRTAFGRSKSVQDIMANFAGEGLPGDAVITTITEYKDGKWQWLFDYIIDLAVEADFRLAPDLISGATAAWRGSMHGFWNDMAFKHASVDYMDSMDFSVLEYGQGFWAYSPYNKATQELSTAVLIDGSTIKTWDAEYVFAGWYDNVEFTGTEVTVLPENSVENINLFAKWELGVGTEVTVTNVGELETALLNEAIEKITIDGILGDAENYTIYKVDRKVEIVGLEESKVFGTFIIKADDVKVDNLTIENKGDLTGESSNNRGGIYVYANNVTLTNNTITNGLGENDGLSNAIQIMSPTENNALSNYIIEGNELIGHDNEVPNWSSSGIVIVQGITLTSIGEYVEVITAVAGDYDNLLANNTFTNNKIDLIHQDWSSGLVVLYPLEPVLEERVIYETSFEASEGFEAGTSYNNEEEAAFGPVQEQWMTYYGTASTTGAISGQSMQMRWYASAIENTGYVRTDFLLENITKIDFKAKNTNGLNVKVQISVDGTTWIDLETFTLSTSAISYTVAIPEEHQDKSLYIKFAMVLPETNPDKTSRVYIDDVVIHGMRVPLTNQEKVNEAKELVEIDYAGSDVVDHVTSDLTLPVDGLHEVSIEWSSDQPAIITSAGVVDRSEITVDTDVTLTATISLGDATATKVFTVTVIPIEEGVTLETVTITNEGAQDGTDVPEGDITDRLTLVNSGTATLTVEFIHNDAQNTNIFNNSAGEIRLYNGGELKIEVSSGYVITEVKVVSSRNNGLSVNGADAVIDQNYSTLIDDLQVVSLKNVDGQLRIGSIEVTYKAI